MLSMQRSRSGWFETLLNSHENLSYNGEIFSVKERCSNITSITKTLDKLYNLDWTSSAAKNECIAAVGLKWMLNQWEWDEEEVEGSDGEVQGSYKGLFDTMGMLHEALPFR